MRAIISENKHRIFEQELRRRWGHIKDRCNNTNKDNYSRYGAKGIKMCYEWELNFESFYLWAISTGYNTGMTIERLNNDFGYSPENCTWIPLSQQGKNRSSSWKILYDGRTQCLSDWCKELNLKRTTIQRRMNSGLSFEISISK